MTRPRSRPHRSARRDSPQDAPRVPADALREAISHAVEDRVYFALDFPGDEGRVVHVDASVCPSDGDLAAVHDRLVRAGGALRRYFHRLDRLCERRRDGGRLDASATWVDDLKVLWITDRRHELLVGVDQSEPDVPLLGAVREALVPVWRWGALPDRSSRSPGARSREREAGLHDAAP